MSSPPFLTHFTQAGLGTNPSNEHSWTEVLHDGQSVLIREIRKQDTELERRFIERLSPTSRRFRFLGTLISPSDDLLRQLVAVDPTRDVALIALIGEGAEQTEVGVARLSAEGDETCEFAVTVSDDWQHKGLGTLLMQHLINSAVERGIKSMHSFDAADNEHMREFAAHLGFKRTPDPDDATLVVHSLDLPAMSDQTIA
ncbi:MAG: GNAT family N-acetyltransferase [Dokdonella sp.]